MDKWSILADVTGISLSTVHSESCQGEAEDSGSVSGSEEHEEITQRPSQEEIRETMNQLKHNALGEGDLTAEMLKLREEAIVHWLTRLSCRMWHSEEVHEAWLKQIVIPLHKRVYDVYDKFRGMALLSVPGKVRFLSNDSL